MRVRIGGRQASGAQCGSPTLISVGSFVIAPSIKEKPSVASTEPCMPLRHFWSGLNSLAKSLLGALVVVARDMVKVPHSAKDQIPGGQAFGRFVPSAQGFGAQHFRRDRAGDAIDDLVLNLEQVGDVAVVAVSPQMVAGFGLDQLGGHPDSASRDRKSTRLNSSHHSSELQSPLNLVCRLLLEK